MFVAGVAWEMWGDYLTGGASDAIPIVRAPTGPIKVRPDTPGGINIPNRDKLVYDRLEKKPPERRAETLLPQPEKPLPAPGAESLVETPGAMPSSKSSTAAAKSALGVGREDILQPTSPPQPSKSVEQDALPAPVVPTPTPSVSMAPPTVAEVQAARRPKPSLSPPAGSADVSRSDPARSRRKIRPQREMQRPSLRVFRFNWPR